MRQKDAVSCDLRLAPGHPHASSFIPSNGSVADHEDSAGHHQQHSQDLERPKVLRGGTEETHPVHEQADQELGGDQQGQSLRQAGLARRDNNGRQDDKPR